LVVLLVKLSAVFALGRSPAVSGLVSGISPVGFLFTFLRRGTVGSLVLEWDPLVGWRGRIPFSVAVGRLLGGGTATGAGAIHLSPTPAPPRRVVDRMSAEGSPLCRHKFCCWLSRVSLGAEALTSSATVDIRGLCMSFRLHFRVERARGPQIQFLHMCAALVCARRCTGLLLFLCVPLHIPYTGTLV